MASLLNRVNILQGTDSHHGFSRGNTLPIAALPFGRNHWSIQTDDTGWWFHPSHPKVQGFRCTHQPSPWIGDYGAFVVMAQTGARVTDCFSRAAGIRKPWTLSPCRLAVELLRDGTVMELVPTEKGAVLRVSFEGEGPRRIILETSAGEGMASWDAGRGMAIGWTKGSRGGAPESFCHHFVLKPGVAPIAWAPFSGRQVQEGSDSWQGERAGIVLEFSSTLASVEVEIRTSFISLEAALAGDAVGFDEALSHAEAAWNARLGGFSIEGGTEDQLRTFASCLYRAHLFPRDFHESTEDGSVRHYSPYDGKVHDGPGVTDNGFWDTYRTVYPLFSLLAPADLDRLLNGWVTAMEEGGWYPQWASPGYRACMVGTHIDSVLADGFARGARGFDLENALDGALHHAFHLGDPEGAWGRIGLDDYMELGWVAADRHHASLARTLDYAYNDWCLAELCEQAGRAEMAETLRRRSHNWRHLWDPETRFFRARNADGSWFEPWTPTLWGHGYIEGAAWQFAFSVPHDFEGLCEVYGGPEGLVAKIEAMLAEPPRFDGNDYGYEIHEMTEMGAADFGQYAHSNQPVHHVLALFALAGRHDLSRHWTHRVLNELYSPDHFLGDEDNGEMASWYILCALGLFPSCPGRAEWTLGWPLFPRVEWTLGNGKTLVIERSDSDRREVLFNGAPVPEPVIPHSLLAEGGTLHFRG